MNAVGFAACWLPASGSCVLLSINQTLSTQTLLGPAVLLVGNTTHSSIHGLVPLNIDLLWDSHRYNPTAAAQPSRRNNGEESG